MLASVLSLACSRQEPVDTLGHLPTPQPVQVAVPQSPAPSVEPLTEQLRAKGFSECNPHDPLGLGPYAPFRRLPLGRMLVPQKGGHTDDMGYDVLIHFHGADAVRKLLVQTARGVVLVLVDKGLGGGAPYTRALATKFMFPMLRSAIEKGLKAHSGSEKAHIRHLALSSWSAGTTATTRLLAQEQEGIDAIIILDGLHGAWKQGAKRVQQTTSLDARFIAREIAFAKQAQHGDGLFVLTHSNVEPTFPSTKTTARLLLDELGLEAVAVDSVDAPFRQTSGIDVKGLHVWGFEGNDQPGHCAQLFLMPRIVHEVLESTWGTPAMDRSVPPTPHPDWQYK